MSVSFYPSSSSYPTSFGNKQANPSSKPSSGSSVVDEFLAYQKLSPQQKIRESILQKYGLTEDSLQNMPTEARKKIEDDIKQDIEKEIKSKMAQKGILVDMTV